MLLPTRRTLLFPFALKFDRISIECRNSERIAKANQG